MLVAETAEGAPPASNRSATWRRWRRTKATKDDIANAFGVPAAVPDAGDEPGQPAGGPAAARALAIRPRVGRRDEKLNERLVPLFDDSGRLFFASDDPVPEDQEYLLRRERSDLETGVRTINEVRAGAGPAAGGVGR